MPQHNGSHHHKSPAAPSIPPHVKAFLDAHLATAQAIQRRYGIPAGILLAQAALESSWGRHVVGNAYFGIKGHAPDGGSTTFTTHEVVNGQRIQTNAAFRAYTGFDDAAEDYARFIVSKPDLRVCYTQGTASKCAVLIAHRGYATDPKYVAKLNVIIKTYKLDQYDTKVTQ
ncbi:glycoside hydrolase family 73 protein [Paraburkholderia dilworthii]|uniref:Glucosaminidase domain-containing protein n=1 Tax=Paraburkholderia dilworthii TaxID=948106 RepID=A0ABW9DK20_9BURK